MKLKVKNLAKALQGIESDRKLSEDVVEEALKEALVKAYRKHVEIQDAYVRVEIKNDFIYIYQQRMVVENVEDDEMEISLEDARKIKPFAQLGDMIDEEVDFSEFDRAAVVLAKNVMKQKIREAEKQQVYEEYSDKVDDMVLGTVESVEDKFVIVNIGKTLAMMKKSAQIPTETYKEGQLLPVVITEVNKETKGAQVMVSRSTPVFVRRLFEKEVPEIFNGIIEIKAIAREPGERCKIAVYSHNENIDPIGACIGPRGQRVQAIINELNGEKIDIFQWSDNLQELIANALAPSEGLAVIPNENVKDGLIVVVPDNQLSLAIGKKGKNARLAVKLSGHKIDIKSQTEMNEAGIDYEAIAKQMQEDYEEKKALERAYKQQQKIQELKETAEEIETIDNADFDYNELELPEEIPGTSDTLYDKEQSELPAVVEDEPEEKVLDEMEEAARIAKEKRREKSLLDEDNATYTSKFESIAGSSKPAAEPVKPKKKEEKEEVKVVKPEKKKPSFNAMKPIYSDEELAEIEEQEEEEALGAWDDDVDYEEYDSYYDD